MIINTNSFLFETYLINFFLEGQPPKMPEGTYYKPKFFDFMLAEFLACGEGVGIIDMSSFSKIEIKVIYEL